MNQYLLQVELLIYKKVVLCEVTFYLTLSWLNSIQPTSKTQVQALISPSKQQHEDKHAINTRYLD